MSEARNGNSRKSVRVGLMSRIDFGGLGFRQGLLEKAAERFRREDINFVVLVGGLIAGKAVTARAKLLAREMKSLDRQSKAYDKVITRVEYEIEDLERRKKLSDRMKAKLKELKADLAEQYAEQSRCIRDLHLKEAEHESLHPENLAEALGEILPKFTNDKGQVIKLYICPSPAYDREVGMETARLLAEKLHGNGNVRLLKAGADRIPLRLPHSQEYFAEIEVLTPEKAAWLRGDYYSTPVERVIKDKRKQSSQATEPTMTIVGCFGSTISKPKGEATVPYVAVPTLNRIEETTVNENQIGVLVLEASPKKILPEVTSHPFKDLVSRERMFIGNPGVVTEEREKCITVLKTYGPRTTGMISDLTGLSREVVLETMKSMQVKRGDRARKTWPGVEFDPTSDRWDFSFPWVLENLRYPDVTGAVRVDKALGFACLHAGSHDTDYNHFLTEVPRYIVDQNVQVLIGAGDFVEGQAHGMMMRQEVVAGSNETDHQWTAGRMIAQVMFTAFKTRFESMLAETDPATLDRFAVSELIRDALVTFNYIPGNHDLWAKYSAQDPLTRMIDTIKISLTMAIEKLLVVKNLRTDYLLELVSSKIVTTPDQRFTLPSGLLMSVQHPHMARAKTTSLRPQEMMDFAKDCPVVVGANFHVGEALELWEPGLGQRFCIQIGTMKHGSPFENGKLKTVDQGFVVFRIESVNGRIVRTSNTFVTNEGVVQKRLDPKQPINDFHKQIGLWI